MTTLAPPPTLADATKPSPLDRLIRSKDGPMSAELAAYVLTLGFTDEELRRYDALSKKVQEESLSRDEDMELHELIWAGDLLSLLKSKARLSLGRK